MIAAISRKDGVAGEPAEPLGEALEVCAKVYGWFKRKQMVITALRDGVHSVNSLHPRGYAVDLRTSDIPTKQVNAIKETLKAQLGSCYDVAIETGNTPGSSGQHIHIEFDPEHNGGANLPIA